MERNRKMKRVILVAILAMALSLSVLQVAFAHAKIDHCTPAASSTVAQAPGQVACVMSEEIDTKLSTMSVWDASGTQVDKKDAHVDLYDPDHKTLLVSLDPAAMNNGIYTVKYHTVTPDDGGITDGTFQFVVGSAAATPASATEVQSDGATVTPAPTATSAASAPPATPAMLPQTGGSQANIGLIVGLLGLAVIGGGLVFWRFTH
jgi:LPXTG-motif cell wall-anchored protein